MTSCCSMRFHLSRRTKRRLAKRFTYNRFIRLLIFKVWFRIAVLGMIALLGFLALFLPKIWTVSPPGVLPTIRISGLDRVQAWSLKRTARREMASDDANGARYAWLAALANNPPDLESLRGHLACLVSTRRIESDALRQTIGQSLWLLRLGGTNDSDLELVTELFGKCGYHDLAVLLLEPRAEALTPTQQAIYLKSLFHEGQVPEFSKRWIQYGADLLPDPELRLYQEAFRAGWGTPDEAEEALSRLRRASDDPQFGVPANRLLLAVGSKLDDAEGCRSALERLSRSWEDSARDHAHYWRLLARNGNMEEGRRLAKGYSGQPRSPKELVTLSDAYAALGLQKLAQGCLRSWVEKFSYAEEVWIKLISLLIEERQWEELCSTALNLRQNRLFPAGCVAYSYFAEGYAQAQLGRRSHAEAAFEKMQASDFKNAALALACGRALVAAGFPHPAAELLIRFEQDLATRPEYWSTLFEVANDLKDPKLLLKAAEREYALAPENVYSANRYAAALLVNRQEADTAVRLTFRLMNEYPHSTGAPINHAFALLRIHRPDDANSILSRIRPDALSPQEATSFWLAKLELELELGRFECASEMLSHIDSGFLFPTDVAWLEHCRRKIEETKKVETGDGDRSGSAVQAPILPTSRRMQRMDSWKGGILPVSTAKPKTHESQRG